MEKVSKVFWISIVIASIFVGWGVVAPAHLGAVMDRTKAFFLVALVGFISYRQPSF